MISISDKFILNANEGLVPDYKISPFSHNDFKNNNSIANHYLDIGKNYLNSRFDNYILTESARNGLDLILKSYDLKKTDVVSIYTTSNNYYISSCVTNTIENHCSWSRKIEDNSKLIIVNHEFGYPYEKIDELRKYNLPIIEDCAYSFLSQEKIINRHSDYIIFSLPKNLPMQMGGVVVFHKNNNNLPQQLQKTKQEYILKCLGYYKKNFQNIIKKRLYNYHYLCNLFSKLDVIPFFYLEKNINPGVFLFKFNKKYNLNSLKTFCQNNGIESSVFYGENAYFIPLHQHLEEIDLCYFYTVIEQFLLRK